MAMRGNLLTTNKNRLKIEKIILNKNEKIQILPPISHALVA